MPKLIAHILVLVLVVGLARVFALGTLPVIVAIIAGMVAVHLVFSRLAAKGSGTVVRIRDDDPLMLEALQEAERTWPRFLALREQYPDDSAVKFRLHTSDGIENVWGRLLAMDGDSLRVQILTAPTGDVPIENPDDVPISRADVIDWQVLLEDDSLLGGFTQQAVFRILLRDGDGLAENLAAEFARYRPLPQD